MVRDPITVAPETPVREITSMMRERSISAAIIVEDGRPVGIVSERDLVCKTIAVNGDPDALQAADVCSQPAVSISELDEVVAALDAMKTNRVRSLVVVDLRNTVVGLLTTDDLGFNLPNVEEELALAYLSLTQRGKTFADLF
jgi:CBS domain-containing protein